MCDPGCNGNCVRGFLNKTELTALSSLMGNVTYASHFNNSYIFPNISFTSSGSVTAWELAALTQPLTPSNMYLPVIEIWRKPSNGSEYYYLVDATFFHGVVLEKTDRYNVYRYMLDPPMEMEEGDIIGVHQPPADVSQVSLAFLQSTGSCFHSTDDTVTTAGSDCDDHELLQPLVLPLMEPISKPLHICHR